MSESSDVNRQRINRYYDRTESRIGYKVLLSGAKHFGWYKLGDSMWRFRPASRQMEDELGKRLALPKGSEVLDAGCGTGAVARSIATRFGLRVWGIDILDWNLEEAIEKSRRMGLQDTVQFKWGDYHDLDFPDGKFAGVYTMETLVHAADPERVLSEFNRVMKPGGRIALFEYSHRPRNAMKLSDWRRLEMVCDQAAMPGWMRFEDGVLDGMLHDAGFTSIATEDVTAQILPMLKAFALIGRLPYWVGRHTGKVAKTVNAMSAVEMGKSVGQWSYNITIAEKRTRG